MILGLFLVDLATPLGVADPSLYLIPIIWIALWQTPKEGLLLYAAGVTCTILVAFGYFLSPQGVTDQAFLNRILNLFVLWVTIIMATIRKWQEEDAELRRYLDELQRRHEWQEAGRRKE